MPSAAGRRPNTKQQAHDTYSTNQDKTQTKLEKMAELDKALEEYAVVMVSKTYCPFCTRAKALLAEYDIKDGSMVVIEADEVDGIQARARELTGQNSVPNVFISGKSHGGCDDVTALHNAGKLKGLLKDAGAL